MFEVRLVWTISIYLFTYFPIFRKVEINQSDLEQIKRVPSIEIHHDVDRVPLDMLSNTPNYLINVRNISEPEFIRIVEV